MKIIKYKKVNQRHMIFGIPVVPPFSPRTSCESKSKKRDAGFYSKIEDFSKIRGGIMNKVISYIILFLIFTAPMLAHNDMTADEIINTMTETMNPEQSQGTMKMTIVTTSGEERTFEYEMFSKDKGDKSLMKYLYPSRVKGQTILMLNDANDIWTFFPKTKRIRKLATHAKKQKLEGSDFSYEDMGASNEFIEEYNSVRLNDEKIQGRTCYKLELTRKPESSAGYSRLVVWVDKEYLVPLMIDYYHDDDPKLLEKQLTLSDIQLVDGIYTPLKMVMYNKLDATHTSMEITDITYEVDLPDDLFTEMGMQK
jgi:outer membrane lipoprotein-sorting protein